MPGDPARSENGTGSSPAAVADGTDPAPAVADEVTVASLGEIRSLLTGLTSAVEREHQRAEHREKIIDRLHDENQRLRHSELQAAFEPVRTALYRLYDLVKRESERDVADPAHVPELLAAIADELAEALARTGVERMPVAEGDPFDPRRHRAVEVRDADGGKGAGAGSGGAGSGGGQGRTVAGVRRTGFLRAGKVVRRAEVIVVRVADRGD